MSKSVLAFYVIFLSLAPEKAETVEHPLTAAFLWVFLQLCQYPLAGKLLEVAHDVSYRLLCSGTYNHVQVVTHQHRGINLQPFFLLAVCQRLQNDVLVLRTGEDIHPVHHRNGDEVQLIQYSVCNVNIHYIFVAFFLFNQICNPINNMD